MKEFHGKVYVYPTPHDGLRFIGVAKVSTDLYVVCFFTNVGRRRRIYSSNLPVSGDADELQRKLDEWADQRGLKEVL